MIFALSDAQSAILTSGPETPTSEAKVWVVLIVVQPHVVMIVAWRVVPSNCWCGGCMCYRWLGRDVSVDDKLDAVMSGAVGHLGPLVVQQGSWWHREYTGNPKGLDLIYFPHCFSLVVLFRSCNSKCTKYRRCMHTYLVVKGGFSCCMPASCLVFNAC